MKSRVKKKEYHYSKLAALNNPKSPIAEAFRTLRTNIQFTSIDKQHRTLMITSPGPNDGKSTMISNLAVVLAQQDKKVLLVDSDLRKPTIHLPFKIPNQKGLTNVLTEAETIQSAVQKSTISNLYILTSGPIPPNPAELLGSKKMSKLVEEALPDYDYILFDAPPAVAVTDAQILSKLVDGVLLVVKSGKTNKDIAIKARRLLENVNANVLGVILNNVKVKERDYYYYNYGNN